MCSHDRSTSMDQLATILECGHEHVLQYNINPTDFKCPTLIRVILPCGHDSTAKPCHRPANEWRCGFPCDIRVEPCGHSCIRRCHVKDDPDHIQYKCYKPGCSTEIYECQDKGLLTPATVEKKLPDANPMQGVECSASIDEIVCTKPCEKILTPCGHPCTRKCHEPCGDCVKTVMKTIPSCGHEIETKCNEPVDIKNCDGVCPKLLPCGHGCTKKCNEVCTTQCRELADHTKLVFCGHKFKIECHLVTQELPYYSNTLLQFCTAPCTAVLDCNHKCSGTCGECAQGRIHATCTEKCGVPLICGHECNIPCREVCQPCQLKCGFRCSHSRCSKTCGEVCTKCQESCPRQCEHVQCTSKCGDLCSVPPCQEACEKKLPCSHSCVGFCGDPCPPLCRICDAEELTEVFLGHEDAIDARFVLLDECKHVIESRGMELFCKENEDNGIGYRRCPKCRTPLTSTQRYNDYVKRAIKDVTAVKEKSNGTPYQIEALREILLDKSEEVRLFIYNRVLPISPGFTKILDACDALMEPIKDGRRQRFDLMIGKILEAKLRIVQIIRNTLHVHKMQRNLPTTGDVFMEVTSYVEYLFKKLTQNTERITNQEINDFKRELVRLERIAQFLNIAENSPPNDYIDIRELIYRPIIFTESYDETVKVRLEEIGKQMFVVGGITEQERLEIIGASGLKKGSWFKCPKDHIYSIGDCGGAMEVGKCNECGAEIGGTKHALVPGNIHAGEMDNSRFPAWSESANMMNYEFDQY